MSNSLNDLLTSLEEVTANAFSLTASTPDRNADFERSLELIQQRSVLIRELSEKLCGIELSYTDFNRLVIISFQGQRLQEQMIDLRARLATSLAANRQQRNYAERLLSCLPSEALSQHRELG